MRGEGASHFYKNVAYFFYSIYSLIFIVEAEAVTQWPANREGKAVLLCLEHWCGWTGIWEGQHSWELSAIIKEDSPVSGAWPKSHIRGYSGQEVVFNDGWWRLLVKWRGVTYQKNAEQNLFGWGFVHISGEYVKGCWHSWTHHLPWLDVKLRNLASTRRTSLEFWRQDVERLILCKLQFWLWSDRKTKSSLLATKVTKLRISKQTCNLRLVGRAASVSGQAYNQAAGQLVETQYAMIAHVFVVSETYIHNAVRWHCCHMARRTLWHENSNRTFSLRTSILDFSPSMYK